MLFTAPIRNSRSFDPRRGATVVCAPHVRAYDLRTGAGLNGEAPRLAVCPAALGTEGKVWLPVPG
jgi:nitrite reductase/ring-hydroxylating ferredoxin subunit